MKVHFKIAILRVLKFLGLFKVVKYVSRRKVLILAYHGFELTDEAEFSPKLYMKPKTLESRMAYLNGKGFHVVPLTDAVDTSIRDKLPDNSIVITIDDGWYSTLAKGHDVLCDYLFPYTLYVTTYYVDKKSPVLNVVLRYIVWKTELSSVTVNSLGRGLPNRAFSLLSASDKRNLEVILMSYLHSLSTHELRLTFIKEVAALFLVDYDEIDTTRRLSLLTHEELKWMSDKGVDIQLHTHRHMIPRNDKLVFENEIIRNKRVLKAATKNRLEHFCYPSGITYSHSDVLLERFGVKSAVTCEPGFVSTKTDPYYLPRFLDGENIHELIFEAEIHGVLELFRNVKRSFFWMVHGHRKIGEIEGS